MKKDFTFVDLFSGAGGFTEGFLLSGKGKRGFQLAGASDLHQGAGATHYNRFNSTLGIDYRFLVKDIRDDDFLDQLIDNVQWSTGREDVDVVVGGPPCQGFSLFGKRDEDDPRNNLFRYYLSVIAKLRPKYFVMENVPGLAVMYGGKVVEKIYDEVSRIGGGLYSLAGPIYVNAENFGVPQARERILFIGTRKDCINVDSILKPSLASSVTASQAIDDLSFLNSWESSRHYHDEYPAIGDYQKKSRRGRLFSKYGIRSDYSVLKNHEAAKHTPEVIARFAMIKPGGGFDSIPRELWDKHLSSNKKWCVRMHPDRPSNTVVTLPDDFVHYSKPRIPTAREMARLQSFDDTFEFLGPRTTGGGGAGNKNRAKDLPQYTQIGNAVPPLLAKGIAETIFNALDA